MIETILSILAAIIAIFVAGLLVQRQDRYRKMSEELDNELKNDLDEAVSEFQALNNSESPPTDLEELERDMQVLNSRLYSIPIKRYRKEKTHHDKRKKDP